ncbi:MAG: arginyl-tRNA synthetase [Xanthobacteraceae bacterium]|nr:arginyl-tRNA synthetase [Xanthobacteraceae bacterium]
MNVFAAMLERVQAAADALAAEGVLPAGFDRTRVTVEPSRDPVFGDITTNAALVLAQAAGMASRQLATAIALKLRADAFVERAEVAGPGFVNITLRPDVWTQALQTTLTDDVISKEPSLFSHFNNFSNSIHDEICDAVRFTMLFGAHDAVLDVDPVKAREQSYENPAFNVQYGHARARAIFRQARDAFPDLPADPVERATLLRAAPLELLADAGDRALLRWIAQYPHVVETAALAREPHRVAVYLHELASAFHAQSCHGKATPHLRFIIQNDRELTVAHLALVEAVVIILAAGLALLGVGAPDEIC